MIKKFLEEDLQKFSIHIIQSIGSTTSLLIHTVLFIFPFFLLFFGVKADQILLVLTLLVSFEAIYLSIFIQMSVNIQSNKLQSVASDIEDIQENVEDIQENVEDIQEDVEDIQEDDEKEDDEKFSKIETTMNKLIKEVMELKKQLKAK
jgi:septal ring factor EnvC (AmiA/AmiB activator)